LGTSRAYWNLWLSSWHVVIICTHCSNFLLYSAPKS
jgi:hypothetical protein